MKPGALVLYIDNAGGGFHQLVRNEAQALNLITVFGPLKHEHFATNDFNVKRFGYTPCLETKVSVHIWRKPSPSQPSNSNPMFFHQQLTNNLNKSRAQPGRVNPMISNTNVHSWDDVVNRQFQGVHHPPVHNWEDFTPYPPPPYTVSGGTHINTVHTQPRPQSRSQSRSRSPKRRGRQQSRNNRNRRPAPNNSGYRPAPEDTSADEEEQDLNCCCVIS